MPLTILTLSALFVVLAFAVVGAVVVANRILDYLYDDNKE